MKYKILSKPELKYLLKNKHLINEEIAKQMIVSRGFYDRAFFVDYFLWHFKQDKKTKEKIASAPFQLDMLQKMGSEKNLNIIYPRNHAKTTNSLFNCIWSVCYRADPFILLVASEWLWVEFLWKLRSEFVNNDKLQDCFGELVPKANRQETQRWTSKQLQFSNWIEIQTVSKGWTIRWKRVSLLIVDDPQENKDVKNPAIASEFIDWFFTSIYNTLDPTGRCIVIGTIMSELCFVNVIANEDRGFTTIRYPAVLNPVYETIPKCQVMQNADGETIEGRGRKHLIGWTPIWSYKRSLKTLDDVMQTIWRDAFQQEYMHEPMSSVGDLVIHPDIRTWLTPLPFTEDPLYPELRIFRPNENTQIDNEGNTVVLPIGQAKQQFSIWVDTSSWTAKGDFSTIVVRDNLKKLYATYRGRIAPDQLCKVIQRLWDLWYYPKEGALGIEVNNTWLVTITEARNAFDGEGYVWYPYIYQQEVFDKTTEKRTTSIWRNTNNKTRPIMVETYKKDIIIDQVLQEFDEREIAEMKTFVYNNNGKAEAPSPYHDDLILADMLSLQMVEVNTYTFGWYTR